MTKFLVETISSHRLRYVIEAANEDDAKDEVVLNMHNADFKEFSQEHIGELISSCRPLLDDEYFCLFDKDNAYLKDLSDARKLEFINSINYEDFE